jgi:hypothetical protein
MYDSVDVTLTNSIIADSLQPPEVARTLVVAGITLIQQCLHVKVVQDMWLSTLRECSTTNKTRISVLEKLLQLPRLEDQDVSSEHALASIIKASDLPAKSEMDALRALRDRE